MAAVAATNSDVMKMEIETITKQTIKPSSPTPPHLRTFKLSFFDQLNPLAYTRFALFYYDAVSSTKTSKRLQESLSETLTRFYPVAGRVKDHLSVDCNDEGVEYLEARAHNCTLSDLLRHPNNDTLSRLVPLDPTPFGSNANPLLLIQATFFVSGSGAGCGSGISLALGVCISHKIADAAAFSAFIKDWSATAALGTSAVVPDFTAAASLFPPVDPLPSTMQVNIPPMESWQFSKTIPVRYVFDSNKIAALKAKAASESVPHPSRLEAVTALIFKCQMAVSRSRRPRASSYALNRPVNLRARFVPPLPMYSFGNMIVSQVMRAEEEEEVVDLRSIVSRLRREMVDIGDYAKRLQGGEEDYVEVISQDCKGLLDLIANEDVYLCSHNSWCKFPFYDADFGWGKPTWMTQVFVFGLPNLVVLTDARDGGGIEALVVLSEEDLQLFQGNQELLTFASLNPSVLP